MRPARRPCLRRRAARSILRGRRARSGSRSRSGTRSRSGLGTLWSTTAPSAVTTSWIYASSVKQTRRQLLAKSALWLGESAITRSIFTASPDGSRPGRFVPSTTGTGSSRSTADEQWQMIYSSTTRELVGSLACAGWQAAVC